MSHQKTYDFHSDGTFMKVNSELDRQVTGDYMVSQVESGSLEDFVLQLTLTFNPEELVEDDHQLMGGIVYGIQGKEVLFLRRNGTLTNSGHGIADGPMYVFHK